MVFKASIIYDHAFTWRIFVVKHMPILVDMELGETV